MKKTEEIVWFVERYRIIIALAVRWQLIAPLIINFIIGIRAIMLIRDTYHRSPVKQHDRMIDQDDSPEQAVNSDSHTVNNSRRQQDVQIRQGSNTSSVGTELNGSMKQLPKAMQRKAMEEEKQGQQQANKKHNHSVAKIFIDENESMKSDFIEQDQERKVKYATDTLQLSKLKSGNENIELKISSDGDDTIPSKKSNYLQVRIGSAQEVQHEVAQSVQNKRNLGNQERMGANSTPNTEQMQMVTQPLVWNEQFKIFEVSLKQREDQKWVQVLILMAKGDINSATINAERLFEQRKMMIDENKKRDYNMSLTWSLKDIYGLVCEGLLLAKCKLLRSNISKVDELLNECELYLGEMKMSIKEIKKQFAEQRKELKENKASLNDDRSSAFTSKKTSNVRNRPASSNIPTFADYKWMLSAYATIAAFYNAIGNQVKCEMAYVKYVQWIEKYFGKDSLEASNCYFLIGLYYYEQQTYQKSLACFIKSLYVRGKELGEDHMSCADCHLNIGILYKKLNAPNKALTSFEKALQIRKECIGPQSLQVANVLEELGKFHLEKQTFKLSYQCFQQCYEIRKKIIRKAHHEDIERVSCLLLYLHKQIEQELQEKEKTAVKPTAQLISMTAQVKDMFKKQIDDELNPDKLFEKSGFSIANKVMKEVFEKQIKPQVKQLQEQRTQSLEEQEDEIEKAVKNYVKQFANKQEESSTPVAVPRLISANSIQKHQKFHEDDDIETLINNGFNSYFDIVKTQLYDKAIPFIISFFLSLTQQQMIFLQKSQLNNEVFAAIYIPQELKESLDQLQQELFAKSQVWKIPRSKYLSGDISIANLVFPEQNNKQLLRQQTQKDQRFIALIQEVPDFIQALNATQKRILQNASRFNIILKYFLVSISQSQFQDFEAIVEEQQREAETMQILQELASLITINTQKGSKESISKILDYKQEMCLVIDNIKNIEVFSCINVDLTENFLSNLQLNQIQRLTKIKQELQNKEPDIEEIQNTLKRFITDLDIKEAYEFSVLNPFLINEEELQELLNEFANDESQGRFSNPLKLDTVKREHSSSSDEDSYTEQSQDDRLTDGYRISLNPRQSVLAKDIKEQLMMQKQMSLKVPAFSKSNTMGSNNNNNYQTSKALDFIRRTDTKQNNARKSLMNVDLDRIVSDAVSRGGDIGTSSFSFTNDNGGQGHGVNISQDFKAGIAEVDDERDFSELSSDPEEMYNDQVDDLSITNGTIIRNLMQK